MEALLIEYAKKFGMEKAMQMLGLDKQTQNPDFTFGMPFTNQEVSLNPMKLLSNNMLSSSGGGMMPLIAGGLGLAYLRNPLRPGSQNYNPLLKGQMDHLRRNNMLGTDQSGLTKIMSGALRGKNIASMFGTNDYPMMLDKKIDWFEDRIKKGKKISQKNYEAAKVEAANYELAQEEKKQRQRDYTPPQQNHFHDNYNPPATVEVKQDKPPDRAPKRESRHSSGPGGLHSNYSRGGVAGLWRR